MSSNENDVEYDEELTASSEDKNEVNTPPASYISVVIIGPDIEAILEDEDFIKQESNLEKELKDDYGWTLVEDTNNDYPGTYVKLFEGEKTALCCHPADQMFRLLKKNSVKFPGRVFTICFDEDKYAPGERCFEDHFAFFLNGQWYGAYKFEHVQRHYKEVDPTQPDYDRFALTSVKEFEGWPRLGKKETPVLELIKEYTVTDECAPGEAFVSYEIKVLV